jgi:hypothetical protein
MTRFTIETKDGVITCEPCDEHEPCDKDIRDLPDGFHELAWHKLTKRPNDWGDDVLVAVGEGGFAYSTFDGWCTEHQVGLSKHRWTDLESFARLQAQVSEGEVEIEDTGVE